MSKQPNALVLDESGVNLLLLRKDIDLAWLQCALTPKPQEGFRKAQVGSVQYLLTDQAASASRLVVFVVNEPGLMGEIHDAELRPEAFLRALRGAYRLFVPAIGIPRDWKPFHKRDSYISFMSNSFHSNVSMRIYIDPNPDRSRNAFVYYIGEQSDTHEDPSSKITIFKAAMAGYQDALAARSDSGSKSIIRPTHVELADSLVPIDAMQLSARQWYDIKLTKAQRDFIDYPLTQSVRLKGPAGSGKTLAMVVKALFSAYESIDRGRNVRIAYLSHSQASRDLVAELIALTDDRALTLNKETAEIITCSTLQNLANSALAFDLSGIEPISIDANEGRKVQASFLNDIIDEYRRSDWLTLRSQCSAPFTQYIESDRESKERMFFLWELLNEFACVIAADARRDSAERMKAYLKEERRQWMMRLTALAEREAVLDLYRRFRRLMLELNVITVDQVIADYIRYLDTFQWDAARRESGFDYIFVDEMHLFDRQERLAFTQLSRTVDKPILLMAYDVKQSPRDTFVGVGAGESEQYDYWKVLGVGETKRFELSESFRYTPEIARLLNAIDARFPDITFGDEWAPLNIDSKMEAGRIPVTCTFKTSKDECKTAVERAQVAVREAKSGRDVAVLCMNPNLFDSYKASGEVSNRAIVLESREDVSKLSHAGKRFVLSMPEYVAGLQFQSVFLLDVSQDEAPQGAGMSSIRRKFVSMLYLGTSRARTSLEIYSTMERGGPHDVIRGCIAESPTVLEQRTPGELGRF